MPGLISETGIVRSAGGATPMLNSSKQLRAPAMKTARAPRSRIPLDSVQLTRWLFCHGRSFVARNRRWLPEPARQALQLERLRHAADGARGARGFPYLGLGAERHQ